MTRNLYVVSQWSGGSITVWSVRGLNLDFKELRGALLHHAKLNASSALRESSRCIGKRVYHSLSLSLHVLQTLQGSND